MPNDKNLNIALRITADIKDAVKNMGAFKQRLDDIDKATQDAGAATRKANDAYSQAAKTTAYTAKAQEDLERATTGTTAAWKRAAAAQSAAMNHYTRLRSATDAQAQAAARVAVETRKEDAALDKLMGSLKTTELQVQRLDEQQRLLERGFKRGRISAEQLAQGLEAIRDRRNALQGIARDAKRADNRMEGLANTVGGLRNALLVGLGGFSMVSLVRDVVRTNLAYQQATYTMKAATDSAAEAAAELDYVRKISEELGLEFLSTSKGYARLMAAVKNSPELVPYMHDIFKAVSQTATALRLLPHKANRLSLALEQMVSKGAVQTEELKRQFGEVVPGAYGLAAEAMGVTTEKLTELLKAGDIRPEEFLPRLAEVLQERFGPAAQQAASGLQAELNRLTNAWTRMKVEAGEAGFIESYTTAVRDLTEVMSDPAVAEGFSAMIVGLGKVISWSVKALAAVANLTEYVAEEIAVFQVGIAAFDIERLKDEATKIRAMLNDESLFASGDRIRFFGHDGVVEYWNDAELKAELAKIDAVVARHYKRQKDLQPNQAAGDDSTTALPGAANVPTTSLGNGEEAKKDNEKFVAKLEKQAATLGKTEAQIRRNEIANRDLTDAQRKRAEAALATIAATKKQIAADKQAQKDLEKLADLQVQFLEATGQDAAAAAATIEAEYSGLRDRLRARGNEDGASLVDQLIDVEKAKANLEALQAEIDRVFQEQARREQSIQTQQQAGLMGELTARREIVDLHRQTADEVAKLLPRMRELAEATGDPAMLQTWKDLNAKVEELRTTVNELGQDLRNIFENSLANALEGLATGTHSLQEAAQEFLSSIAQGIAELAAKNLARQATQGLANLFGGQNSQSGSMVEGAAAVTASATALGAAGGIVMAAANQMQQAATTMAIANGVSMASGVAAATGGHITGPGTYTSDSIPAMLSNQEFVTRAAVVTQPGALNFLHDFNTRGMPALDDWAQRVRHATGGLAGIPAPAPSMPALPSGRLTEPAAAFAASAQITNRQTFNLIDSPERVAEALNTPAGNEAITVMLSRNPAKFRQILGVNN